MICKMKFYKALCLGGIVFYLAVLPLYINLMYEWYLRRQLEILLAFVVLLASSTIVTNLVSAILVMRETDTRRRCCDRTVCILMHCSQLGLLWRFSKLVISFDDLRLLEFSLLLVGQTATSHLPAALLEGTLLKLSLDLPTGATVSFLVICVMSSAFAFVIAQLAFRSTANWSEDPPNVKMCLLSLCHIAGVVCLLTSRCVSVVLFYHSQTYWITVLLGMHFLVCFVASLIYRYLELKRITFLCVLRQTGLMFLHVFDAISTSQKSSKCVSVLYYALVVVENIVMTAVWVMTASQGSDISKLITVMVMLGTFVFGVILKFVCHSCHDDDSQGEDSDMKTLDLMATSRASSVCLQVTSKSCSVSQRTSVSRGGADTCRSTGASQRSKPRSKGTNSNSSNSKHSKGRRSNRRKAQLTYHNVAFDNTPEFDTSNREVVNVGDVHPKIFSKNRDKKLTKVLLTNLNVRHVDRTPSKRSQIDRLKLKAQRGYCSEEITDMDSSNSRNTNTLDVSAQSTTAAHCVRYQTENSNQSYLWRSGMNATSHQVVRAGSHDDPIRPKSCVPFSTNPSYPITKVQTCNKFSGHQDERGSNHHDHLGDIIIPQTVQRGNPVNRGDSYGYDFYTDTTSYYDSLSYYYTISSSSFISDSEFAQTWPPSQPTGAQNHHLQLPDQKLSPDERISIWIQRSKQYFSQDFPKTVQDAPTPTSSLKRGRDRKSNVLTVGQQKNRNLPPQRLSNAPRRWLKPGSKYPEKTPPPNYHIPSRTRNKQCKPNVTRNYEKEDSLSAFSHKANIFAISGHLSYVNRRSVPYITHQSPKCPKDHDDIRWDREPKKPTRPPRPPREGYSDSLRLDFPQVELTMPVEHAAEFRDRSHCQTSALESMV